MMTSLTIDTSVFMLPEKKEDMKPFFSRLWKLFDLEKSNFITVSYMNNIPNNLEFVKPKVNGADEKIIDYTGIRAYLKNLNEKRWGKDFLIIKMYIDKLFAIWPKQNRKNKIGIYTNIPGRNEDPDEQYGDIRFDPNIYVNKPESPVLFNTFKKYLGYLAYLNDKYASEDVNYIVLGAEKGKEKTKKVEVTLMKDDKKVSGNVNVVGIDEISADLPQEEKKEFELLDAFFFNEIVRGNSVNHDNFTKVTKVKNLTEKEVQKVFFYLKTLNEIVVTINEKDISNEVASDKNIVELMNAHGLLCSPEPEATMSHMKEHNCPQRTLYKGAEKDILFDFHLKPVTNDKNNGFDGEPTVRIYIAWDSENKKIIVGWLGRHLPYCAKRDKNGQLTETECPFSNCGNNPKNPKNPLYQGKKLDENC